MGLSSSATDGELNDLAATRRGSLRHFSPRWRAALLPDSAHAIALDQTQVTLPDLEACA